ncbi:MAG: Gfo/Idh/MocA family oxidoreductase [Devosia sp.]
MAPKPVGIGVIGLGNISGAYLKAAAQFPILDFVALADMSSAAAEARSKEYGIPAVGIDALMADPRVEIVLNLTIPKAHVEVGLRAIAAGKSVYSEKPLGVSFAEGKRLADAAAEAGVLLGCAPDTFFGGSHQLARQALDEDRIGTVIGGTAFMMVPGHERWHPNPAFYYAKGGGPMLDMGPYYITDLVNLLGPVTRVTGMTSRARDTRIITAKERAGEVIPVEVETHLAGLLQFASGAIVQITMSFDVTAHRHTHIELYGTKGSMVVPDPNRFDGDVEVSSGGDWDVVGPRLAYSDDNYRSIGLADMALALRNKRPHRASGALALHVLEVMEAVGEAASRGTSINIGTTVERPAPLAGSLSGGKLSQ